jgi:DNA-binding NarL/FixJ family response regulator
MISPDKPVSLAVVDDHRLFRKGLISLINMACPGYSILFEADSGSDLQQKIDKSNLPEIILMDVNMPGMDGFECVKWLRENYPTIKVLVVSMIEREETVVRMLKLGVSGYLCKDVEPAELRDALAEVARKGFYYTDFITGKLVHALQNGYHENTSVSKFEEMNDQERKFLELACSEMTYNQIADKMFLSPKTIDGYRSSLFEKLNVKSRVGLALFAVKNGWVQL